MNISHKKSGFTLLEMLVFVVILGLVLLTATSLMIQVTRQARINYHRVLATQYATEVIEWLRVHKEASWSVFYATLTEYADVESESVRSGEYCVTNRLLLDTPFSSGYGATLSRSGAPGGCSFGGIIGSSGPQIYRRTINYEARGADNILKVTVVVSWQEGGRVVDVPLIVTFNGL